MAKNETKADSLDSAIKKGATKLQKRLDQHLNQVFDVRKKVAVKNSGLVTDDLTKHIPAMRWYVKKRVANLRTELREIIWEIATGHELRRFEPLRKDFETLNGVSKRHLDRGTAILDSEQQMFISYHSVFLACKACSEVNKSMLSQIAKLRHDNSKDGNELELLLKNAIIVFEVTSLIIDMIQNFRLKVYRDGNHLTVRP